jgi:hypothetical protein
LQDHLLARARQVIQRLDCLQVTSRLDAEGRAGVAVLDILEEVVVEVDVVPDKGADNVLPEDAGVLGARNSLAVSLASNGPASLGNPDGLSDSRASLIVGIEEELSGTLNAVLLGLLEVGVRIHANPVKRVNDRLGGAVEVDLPGIDVTNADVLQSCTADSIAGLLNVLDQLGRSSAGVLAGNTPLGVAVEVLTADGDTDDEIGELVTVLLDGGLESADLVVEAGVTSRCPHAEKESGLCVDGSLDGLDDLVGSAVLDHGVQTGASPAIGARELLCGVELIFKVDLLLRGVIVELGTVVEAAVSSVGGGEQCRRGEDG